MTYLKPWNVYTDAHCTSTVTTLSAFKKIMGENDMLIYAVSEWRKTFQIALRKAIIY